MNSRLKELFVLHFFNDGIRTTFIVLLPFVAKDLSLSLAQVGFLGSSQQLISALLSLPAGFLMSKYNGFKIILLLLLIYSLGGIGVSLSSLAVMVFIMYFVAAAGFGMFHTIGFALTAKNSSEQDVGKNMGNFTAIGEIGRVAIPPAAVFFVAFIGWRTTLGTLGFVGLLILILFYVFVPTKNTLPHAVDKQSQKDFLKDALEAYKQKRAVVVLLTAIIDGFASSPVYVYLPFLLIASGLHGVTLSIAMGGFFIGSFAGKYLLGRFVDTLGNHKVFIISELCMAVGLFLLAQTSQHLLLVLISMLIGIFTKGTYPVIQTMFSELTDKEHYHKVFAVSEMVISIAAVITITTMGAIADEAGLHIIFYLASIVAVLATVPIIVTQRMHV